MESFEEGVLQVSPGEFLGKSTSQDRWERRALLAGKPQGVLGKEYFVRLMGTSFLDTSSSAWRTESLACG